MDTVRLESQPAGQGLCREPGSGKNNEITFLFPKALKPFDP